MQAGEIPVVMLVREGAVIPHMKLAQSTAQMDWANLEMVVYAATVQNARGLVCLPADNVLRRVEAAGRNGAFSLTGDPLAGKAKSTVRLYSVTEPRP
jgi:alpha-D-xyloside xylohydrolase